MTIHTEISALRQRIARTELECDTWRAAGRQENYIEAYTKIEALETQLDQLQRTARRLDAELGAMATPKLTI
jgi:hypothetical protein